MAEILHRTPRFQRVQKQVSKTLRGRPAVLRNLWTSRRLWDRATWHWQPCSEVLISKRRWFWHGGNQLLSSVLQRVPLYNGTHAWILPNHFHCLAKPPGCEASFLKNFSSYRVTRHMILRACTVLTCGNLYLLCVRDRKSWLFFGYYWIIHLTELHCLLPHPW